LLKIREILLRDGDEFSRLICVETGKPLKEARIEAQRCGETLTFELVIAAVTLIGAGGRGLFA